jgi:hypothetical protein
MLLDVKFGTIEEVKDVGLRNVSFETITYEPLFSAPTSITINSHITSRRHSPMRIAIHL